MYPHRIVIQKLLLTTIVLLFTSISYAKEIHKLTLGIFPHLPRHKLFEVYSPVGKNFSKTVGIPVTIKTQPSFAQFESAIKDEMFDIALIQPFDYPDAHDKYNYLPLARRAENLSLVILVKKDSTITSLKELKGKVIANAPKTAAVSILTDILLKNNGYKPYEDFVRVYKNNHFSCMQSVLIKKSDACGTSFRALKHYEDDKMLNRFKVIAESESIPHVLFIAHKRVPETVREQIRTAIINWKNTEEGLKIIKAGRIGRFKKALDVEYNIIREM